MQIFHPNYFIDANYKKLFQIHFQRKEKLKNFSVLEGFLRFRWCDKHFYLYNEFSSNWNLIIQLMDFSKIWRNINENKEISSSNLSSFYGDDDI